MTAGPSSLMAAARTLLATSYPLLNSQRTCGLRLPAERDRARGTVSELIPNIT